MSIVAKQKELIERLQDKLEQSICHPSFTSALDETTASTLNVAIAGLKELLSIPTIRQGSDFVVTGLETEHVFDSETYNLLTDIVKVGLESPDQSRHQLKLVANILGINGHQIQS